MSKIVINGERKLGGEIKVQGAKNSALPILAASLLCSEPCTIHNIPDLSDIDAAIAILNGLGVKTKREDHTVVCDASSVGCAKISETLMREMRSSIVFLGAVAARCGRCVLSFPGGCELGPRPIDLHLAALRRMGMIINEEHGCLDCYTSGSLHGCEINLPIPSVGATENIMLAASTAAGTTIIRNAAREPEIIDLAEFLNKCGARVSGAGDGTVTIRGVKRLTGCTHRVICDRIAAATYMAAAAVTGGKVTLRDITPQYILPVIPAFEEAGCEIKTGADSLSLTAPERLHRIKAITTMPYPGFPTDAQPPLMAMTTVTTGTSIFVETIFQNRFKHVGELERLGARIRTEGKMAVVEGVKKLSGTTVEATDLRGGGALIVAGLAAGGKTVVEGVNHIKRGYDNITGSLAALNADITIAETK